MLLIGCLPTQEPRYMHARGVISGKVVDPGGRPVADATVWAVEYSSWMPVGSTLPMGYVAARTVTAADGTFTLSTRAKVKQLSAHTKDFRMIGELNGVRPTGNVIRILRPRQFRERI